MENLKRKALAMLLLYIFAALVLLCSCGTKKRVVTVDTKTADLSTLKTDNSISTSKIDLERLEITVEPIDPEKPFTYKGQTYTNTKIKETYTKEKQENKVETKVVDKAKSSTKEKVKAIDSAFDNTTIYRTIGWVVFGVAALAILIYFFPRWFPYLFKPKE
jgi:preprotein translocase subunit SecF